mgnify:CR=1 FL=1
MTKEEREYANLQNRKDVLQARLSSGVTSIKNKVNSSRNSATNFFSVAAESGTRDLLMSAAGIISCNVNHLLSEVTPEEAVAIYTTLGVLSGGGGIPAGTEPRVGLLATLILAGYQVSSLPESPYSTASSFDLQVQGDGSVVVGDPIP